MTIISAIQPAAPPAQGLLIELGPTSPDLSRREAVDLMALASATGVRQSSRRGSYQGSR